jgi:hypothetical protein
MAVFLPVLKVALPYITQAVAAAIPAFTSKAANGKADEIIPKQIAELQSAVTHNAETVKGLAIQLKDIVQEADAGMARLNREIATLKRLAYAAIAVAVISTIAAIWAVAGSAAA